MPYEAAPGVQFWRRDELMLPPPVRPVPDAAQKTEFIVHHSGGAQLGRADFAPWWLEIYRFHTQTNGWNDIGYNFGVATDPHDPNVAHVLEGRGWKGVGAHTIGHNSQGLGVCYLRNGAPTPGVKRAYRFLSDDANKSNPAPLALHVHSDFYATECPGDLKDWVEAGMPVDAFPSGSQPPSGLNAPIVGVMTHPAGYVEVASDGGVFCFGGAPFFGSLANTALQAPIVAGFARPQGDGYWLVGGDGGVFAYGAAQFLGSMAGRQMNKPAVGGHSTPSGEGYRIVAADGGVFCFGDAEFLGSPVK